MCSPSVTVFEDEDEDDDVEAEAVRWRGFSDTPWGVVELKSVIKLSLNEKIQVVTGRFVMVGY